MLPVKRSAGVALEVNVRNPLRAGDKTQKQGHPLWLWNQEETSPEVQNKVVSGPTKGLMSSKTFF